jgi:AmmeMemoRadiSam system protein A
MLSAEARDRLLKIAREAVEAAVGGGTLPAGPETHPELQGRQGCFVTLRRGGQLRGCLGCFTSEEPLWETVREHAVAAATQDPRFRMDPVTPDEVPRLQIEISVLSPLERIENPLDLELGRHGILIRRGLRRGCFLPQVAAETGWSKEEFLSHCCVGKAGLEPEAWRSPDTKVMVFTAEVFGEVPETG